MFDRSNSLEFVPRPFEEEEKGPGDVACLRLVGSVPPQNYFAPRTSARADGGNHFLFQPANLFIIVKQSKIGVAIPDDQSVAIKVAITWQWN